jgi:hypothetical protein
VLTPEAVRTIQEVRQDATIRADEVGELDYKVVVIERRKREYDNYMAELRAKQADGTIDEGELLILEGETYGWPTPEPEVEGTEAPVELTRATPTPDPAYPAPAADASLEAYPPPQQWVCPPRLQPNRMVIPKEQGAPHRGPDPATLPPEAFEIDIYSVEIQGDIAKTIVHKSGVTSEMVLVKVEGQWYIAGTKLLNFVGP